MNGKRASFTSSKQARASMSRGLKFVDSFWETDYNGTLGFDLLCKRIREGQKTCKDIEDFLKKKSKIETKYGRDLRNLTATIDSREETGDIGLSVQELRRQTERTATFHEKCAVEYTILADEVAHFLESFRQEAKQHEDKVKEKQKIKREKHARMTELHKTYQDKCREYEHQENQHEAAKHTVTTSAKDIEKARVKAEKCKETMEKADQVYRQMVDTLEQWRRAWTADMEDACQAFQRGEEDRIFLLRDVIWRCSNVDSKLCVDRDEACELVRDRLERCDVTSDINEFIQNNRTGSDRPVAIEYENFFQDVQREKSPQTGRRRAHPPLPPVPGESLQTGTRADEYSSVYSVAH